MCIRKTVDGELDDLALSFVSVIYQLSELGQATQSL